MKETRNPNPNPVRPERSRGAQPSCFYPRTRPIHATFGPAGEAPNESAEEDATAEWLAHVEAGRIG
jgi:hypothetical protein